MASINPVPVKQFIIVKNAAPRIWKSHWERDPGLGVRGCHSAHISHYGAVCRLKPAYEDRKQAMRDIKAIAACNPTGYYRICPLLAEAKIID